MASDDLQQARNKRATTAPWRPPLVAGTRAPAPVARACHHPDMGPPLLQLHDRDVDLDAHEVRVGEQCTALSKNEVALLRYLLDRDGAPVSRQELHGEVFGYAPQVVSRAADYAVHRLRRKLEADPSAPAHLLTVPGVGFRLVVASSSASAGDGTTQETAPRRHLPADTTSFLGREEELSAVLELLESGARLVTLVGPGGVGKTRLSRSVGARWFDRSQAAVSFCDLSQLSESAALWTAVAEAIGYSGSLGPRPVERLGGILAARPQLLILDNVEQIIQPVAAAVQTLLEAAPALRMLLTSRERTRATGEHIYELLPLDDTEGARLFIERARVARPSFVVEGEDERQTVLHLVRHLDGLPLAIELAAARSPVLAPQQMLDRMIRTAGIEAAPRDAPDRQATLSQAFAWSWELLSPADRAVLAQLTAFVGSFDVDDAEAVVALPVDVEADSVVQRVQALREKSLLAEVADAARPRFRMLQAVRDFAAPRCANPEGLFLRHARWVVRRTTGPARAVVLADSRHADVLVAHSADLAAAIRRLRLLPPQPALFAQAVAAAQHCWMRSAGFDDYLALLDTALHADPPPPTEDQLWLRLAGMSFCQPRGGHDAPASCAAVLSLLEGQGARPEAAAALLLLASHHHQAKRLDDALGQLERARQVLSALPLGALSVRLEIQTGNAHIERRDFDAADQSFRRAASIGERAGIELFESLIYLNRAVLRGWERRPRDQAAMARRALLSAREQGQGGREVRALLMLSLAESEIGELDDAQRHATDAVSRAEAQHYLTDACDARVALAGIEFARGELDAVRRHVQAARALQDHVRSPYHRAYIAMWDGLACWARWGSLDEAAALLREADDLAHGNMPTGELLIRSKLLAVRAHLEPDAADELLDGWRQLQETAHSRGAEGIGAAVAVDRAHLALAAARRAPGDRSDIDDLLQPVHEQLSAVDAGAWGGGGLQLAWSRVLLASALAEVQTMSQPSSACPPPPRHMPVPKPLLPR